MCVHARATANQARKAAVAANAADAPSGSTQPVVGGRERRPTDRTEEAPPPTPPRGGAGIASTAGPRPGRAAAAPAARSPRRPGSRHRRRSGVGRGGQVEVARSPAPRSGGTRRRTLERLGASPSTRQRQPEDDGDGDGGDAPERRRRRVRDREEESEEDGDARPLEVVGDHEADRERSRGPSCTATSLRQRSGPYDRTVPEAPVTPDDVRRAADVIEGAVHRTPTFTLRAASAPAGI